MITFLQDTNNFESYDGSAWKIVYTTPQSGNAIINGAFDIWQRGTSTTFSGSSAWVSDRWLYQNGASGYAGTFSKQIFTPGSEVISGVSNYARLNITTAGSGATYHQIENKIEDAGTFAGQTVTISFWAKADSARTLKTDFTRNYGSGGSSTDWSLIGTADHSLTTTWTKFTRTVAIPAITGKTIGGGSFLSLIFWFPLNATCTIDITGVQLEAGSVATPFKRNAPSIQAELAACQRYYWRQTCISSYERVSQFGRASSSTVLRLNVQHPVTMRTAPSSIDYANLVVTDGAGTIANVSSIASNIGSPFTHSIDVTASGMTSSQMYALLGNPANTSWLGFNAEL
jgi:hypothetical protein